MDRTRPTDESRRLEPAGEDRVEDPKSRAARRARQAILDGLDDEATRRRIVGALRSLLGPKGE